MGRPNVLIVTSEKVWPPRTGGQARVAGIVSVLRKTCNVTIVGPKSEVPDDVVFHEVDVPFDRRISNYLSRKPRLGRSAWKAKAIASIQGLIESNSYDTIFITHSYLAAMLKWSIGGQRAKIVVDFQNVEIRRQEAIARSRTGFKKALPVIETLKAKAWEPDIAKRADYVVAVSEADLAEISMWSSDTYLVPNSTNIPNNVSVSPPDGYALLACSGDYPPNLESGLWILRSVWPLVLKSMPNAKLVIAGRNTDVAFGDAARATTGVRVLGSVETFDPVYQRSAFCLAPVTYGGGTQLKVIESLAQQRAIVSTTYSVKSVPKQMFAGVAVADTPGDFADEIVQLFANLAKRRAMEDAVAEQVFTLTWDYTVSPLARRILHDSAGVDSSDIGSGTHCVDGGEA